MKKAVEESRQMAGKLRQAESREEGGSKKVKNEDEKKRKKNKVRKFQIGMPKKFLLTKSAWPLDFCFSVLSDSLCKLLREGALGKEAGAARPGWRKQNSC